MRACLAGVLLTPLLCLTACPCPARGEEALRALVDRYWSELLDRHPLEATLFVGDRRNEDRVNDPSVAAYEAWLGSLREIDRELRALPDLTGRTLDERIDKEVLAGMIADRIALAKFGDHLIPLAQLLRSPTDVHADDLHLVFAQLGEFHPAFTAGDVQNYVRRLDAFPELADGLIAVMNQGIAEKRMPPKVVTRRVLPQLRALASEKAEESPLWAFVERLPKDRREDAAKRVRASIQERVAPGYRKLAEFVERVYLPACRESIGLVATPDGGPHYALLVKHYTTTDLTPEAIHAMGLAQIAKAREGMEAVRRKVGFEGDLPAFLSQVRDDPALRNRTSSEILKGHQRILQEMSMALPKLFGKSPASPFEVRAFDSLRAKSSPAGEYLPMPSDGSRPGIFFVNTMDPESRPTYTMRALAYHEALPGHHFQGALAAEMVGRPPFRRFFYIPAFDEGWALYAEGLGAELGLYKTPHEELGRLSYDAQRSARLVVDTGIHAMGWSREQAVAYFAENTAIPRNEIENEVDRYIAWPGQALAYKVGELTIRKIRADRERLEGEAFDLKAFHDRLLSFGSVPARLLEKLMETSREP